MAFVPCAIEAERDRLSGELAPEITPLRATLQTEKFLVELACATDVFRVVHHKIDRSNRNRRAAGGDAFLFHARLGDCGL